MNDHLWLTSCAAKLMAARLHLLRDSLELMYSSRNCRKEVMKAAAARIAAAREVLSDTIVVYFVVGLHLST